MAKDIEVTETFSVGKNEYTKGNKHSFSDEMALKYANKVREVKPKVKKK